MKGNATRNLGIDNASIHSLHVTFLFKFNQVLRGLIKYTVFLALVMPQSFLLCMKHEHMYVCINNVSVYFQEQFRLAELCSSLVCASRKELMWWTRR